MFIALFFKKKSGDFAPNSHEKLLPWTPLGLFPQTPAARALPLITTRSGALLLDPNSRWGLHPQTPAWLIQTCLVHPRS